MFYLLSFTLIFAPLYAWRFTVLNLPVNFLMLWVFLVWLVWLTVVFVQNRWQGLFVFFKKLDKNLLLLILLFLFAGALSVFIKGFNIKKLAQFIVLFLQPTSLFFIAAFHFDHNPQNKRRLPLTAYCLLAAAGLYAIVQYFTLWGLPPEYWGNSVEPKRALAFFFHPNFYALFAAPLLAFLIPDVAENLKSKILNLKSLAWLLGAVGLLLSMSRAGWLGLAAAIVVYVIVVGDRKIKKLILGTVIVMVLVIVSVPNFRYRLLLPFYGEKSANSRIELWQSGWQAVKKSPLLGSGLTGYKKVSQHLINDQALPEHNFPHNIFLNFWVETGLLGLISLIGLMGLYIYRGLKKLPLPNAWGGAGERLEIHNQTFALAISLFLITLLVQGLFDNPYFKNDLAVVFWLVLSLAI